MKQVLPKVKGQFNPPVSMHIMLVHADTFPTPSGGKACLPGFTISAPTGYHIPPPESKSQAFWNCNTTTPNYPLNLVFQQQLTPVMQLMKMLGCSSGFIKVGDIIV